MTHSEPYAHKLTMTRRLFEKSSYSQGLGLEQGAACHPPDPHLFLLFPGGLHPSSEETHGTSGQCVSFSLIDVGSGFTAYAVFLFLFFSCSKYKMWLCLEVMSVLHAADSQPDIKEEEEKLRRH